MKKLISIISTFVMLLITITISQAAEFSGGGYNFVCADGGRYLNVYAGKDADGTNVCVWEKDGSPEQNYTISACGGAKYKLYPASSSSRVIDVNRGNSYNNPLKAGLNIDLWQTNDAPAQEFYITHVGNNLYKIELAALPGHVLQANNPGKNNGNVTLEKYSGASNQHWKILKNGTQVTEPCTHKNVANKNEKSTTEQKNDDIHAITKTYDRVCNDCGKTVESNVKETRTEKHTILNNRCKICGYEVPVVEEKPVETPPVETPTVCEHEKTYTVDNRITYGSTDKDIKVKDNEYHIVYYYADEYCLKCNALVNKKTIMEQEVPHTFLNGVCTVCLHNYHTEKPEGTELRINKTTFTPGEKIELNWPMANRAASYDIHIYKEGMSSRYRMDSGFKENSANIIINDEGTFELAIYSINNQGYTRGNSIKITVKSPYTEKTAYVYNTGGKNLYLRSGASTKTSIVEKMPEGSQLTVTGDAVNGFYPVKFGKYSGYASAEFITFTKSSTVVTNSNNSNFIWPVKGSGRVTCVFGGYKGHYGVDIGGNPAGKSMEIVAAKAGTVSYVTSACSHDYAKNYNCGCAGGYGRYIKINHGDGTETRYCHLRSISVKNGQYVSQGQKIGMMGTTGWSSGVHLHFEIRVNGVAKNPQNYIKY